MKKVESSAKNRSILPSMMKRLVSFFYFFLLCVTTPTAIAKTVHYELTIENKPVNMSGKKKVDFSLTVNGGIPAPTLEFTEGDDAEIEVNNKIPNQETSLHWHGLLVPPNMDGVPYVTNAPIKSGESFTFKFKIRQSGTYWYHSHTMTQEQEGVYGAIVIHPKKETLIYDREVVVMLNDWADENGKTILQNLRKDGDYYLYKKGTLRSWAGAIQAGKLSSFLQNEWTRMGGMDLSDVGYDAFLMNGLRESQLIRAHPGEKIRIRIINGGTSSYFFVSLAGLPMKVVAADGHDIEPILTKEILMGMAETYDVIFEVPEPKNYELKVFSQDGTGSASGFIGEGEKVFALPKAPPEPYLVMNHSAPVKVQQNLEIKQDLNPCERGEYWDIPMQMCMPGKEAEKTFDSKTSKPVLETLTVDALRAKEQTVFDPNAKRMNLKLVLGGNMQRYVWYFNDQAIFEDRTIVIHRGDVIRFELENATMMHHPIHLHGHFFRVINESGEFSPLKHTVDVPPHGKRVIEFLANEPGAWMLHCHNLFHMNTGMARVIEYSDFTPVPEISHLKHQDHHLHDPWYFYGNAEIASNHAQSTLRFSQTWNEIEARLETRNTAGANFSFHEPWETEGDLLYHRWFGQYFYALAGGLFYDQEASLAVGFGYLLPFLIESRALMDHRGNFRIDAKKKFQWSKTLFTESALVWRPKQTENLNRSLEYEISLMFGPTWTWAAGLMFTERSVGAGAQFQF